jgi:hypothetical protein
VNKEEVNLTKLNLNRCCTAADIQRHARIWAARSIEENVHGGIGTRAWAPEDPPWSGEVERGSAGTWKTTIGQPAMTTYGGKSAVNTGRESESSSQRKKRSRRKYVGANKAGK